MELNGCTLTTVKQHIEPHMSEISFLMGIRCSQWVGLAGTHKGLHLWLEGGICGVGQLQEGVIWL